MRSGGSPITGLVAWLVLAAAGAGTAIAARSEPAAEPDAGTGATDASIRVDAAAAGIAVNPLLLGSNVQWVYGGDNLLEPQSLNFDPAMLRLVRAMHPTVLRYPGGDQADVYDFARGIGPIGARGTNPMAPTSHTQVTYMGSAELLELAAGLGAESLFTVNAVTGTAAHAAAWVRLTNVTGLSNRDGTTLPKARYWEIGNEPYLPSADGSKPGVCRIDPRTYAARVDDFAADMRAVDPGIKIGIALANDLLNGMPFVSPGCRGFATTVLDRLAQPVDFVSLHDAYMPYDASGRDHPARDEYLAAMAAAHTVQADLGEMRALLRAYPRFRSLPFALTEYNASFSLNPASRYVHAMASPAGALYVADLLCMLAGREDILMANIWSLSANDHWGVIHAATAQGGPYGRPTYEVFRLLGETLQGLKLPASVQAPTFDAPSLGFSAAQSHLPVLSTLVTRSVMTGGARVLRLLILNKDYAAHHVAAVAVANARISSVHVTSLTTDDVFASDDAAGTFRRTEADPPVSALSSLPLPAHGITLVTLRFTPESK